MADTELGERLDALESINADERLKVIESVMEQALQLLKIVETKTERLLTLIDAADGRAGRRPPSVQ